MKSKQELAGILRQKRQAVLIVNTHSRKGEKLFQRARDLLQSRGIDVVASHPVRDPGLLREVILQVIGEGHTLIIVGGGDGTFNTVIDLFVHRDLVLGVLPLGTANNFARSMGIPMNLEGAVDAIVQGKVVDVDLGMINGQYFINVASIGFSRDIISATPRRLKRYLGIASYLLYETKYLISLDLFRCTIRLERETVEVDTRQVIIANGGFYGTRKFSPDAHIDNGTLIIFMMDSLSRWQGLKFWIGYILGHHLKFPESRLYKTESAIIETEPRKYVIIGGEKTVRTPIQVKIDPAAVKIMAPASFHDHDERREEETPAPATEEKESGYDPDRYFI
ncbi:diacylglycerol/lipid kinase family protein [Methanosphaerula subterraneus]|uniref:diacylglycerol/lipid kinase family protein n=1 Tax=Methanosphaerula subterraneus TaxID=3350244 RepID=UPI003F8586D5